MKKLRIFLAALLSCPLYLVMGQPVFTPAIRTMPVSIIIPTSLNTASTGSGFYLLQSNNTYLVTASHVLFQIISNRISDTLINSNALFTSDTYSPDGRVVLQVNLEKLKELGLLKRSANRDVAVVQIYTAISNKLYSVGAKVLVG